MFKLSNIIIGSIGIVVLFYVFVPSSWSVTPHPSIGDAYLYDHPLSSLDKKTFDDTIVPKYKLKPSNLLKKKGEELFTGANLLGDGVDSYYLHVYYDDKGMVKKATYIFMTLMSVKIFGSLVDFVRSHYKPDNFSRTPNLAGSTLWVRSAVSNWYFKSGAQIKVSRKGGSVFTCLTYFSKSGYKDFHDHDGFTLEPDCNVPRHSS